MLSYLIGIQRKEAYSSDFRRGGGGDWGGTGKGKKSCNVSLRSDIYKLISFTFGLMIDTTKVYSLFPVLVTFAISQGHDCSAKLSLSFSCKVC